MARTNDSSSFDTHDLGVAVDIQEIKTDIRWIKEALEKQQNAELERIKNCIACKKEIDNRFKPLEKSNDIIKWVVGVLALFSIPLILEWLKAHLGF